jgi:DNA helicase-2/ATP-dependent DNA helicase PcrA
MIDIESQLNPKQWEAASCRHPYLRIIAGAGTGKTRTLSYRLAYLMANGISPKRIVAITFTNKASHEMDDRVRGILAQDGYSGSYPLISTFHGFCYRFLRKEISHMPGFTSDFNIVDDEDQNGIFKQIFQKMPKGNSKEYVSAVVEKISSLKSDGRWVKDLQPTDIPLGSIYTYDELRYVYGSYQDYLRSQHLLDFDDLLMFTTEIMHQNTDVRLLWESKYDMFLVDEFQDTNPVQYELVKLFMRKPNGEDPGTMLTVVGDPDQTIYTWRGAKNEIIKTRLQKDFPSLDTVVLDDNYRSTQAILDAANALIQHNHDRIAKNLSAASKVQGEDVRYVDYANSDSEAYDIASTIHSLVSKGTFAYNDIAILYRANYLSNPIEKQLTAFKIPYQVYGGLKFYERAEIKDALAYLRLLVNPDDLSLQRVLNAPSKGIGDVTLARAKDKAKELGEDTSLYQVFRFHGDELRLTIGSKAALANFFAAYDRCVSVYRTDPDNATLLSAIVSYFQETGFRDYVSREDKKNEEKYAYTASSSVSKTDNVNEFIRSLTSALDSPIVNEDGTSRDSNLEDFLISVALQSDQDTMVDAKQVSLMTGHVSKGLEFPFVFVTGVNDGIFPTSHALRKEGSASIEEERRLFYVCLTRAKKKLYVSSFGGHDFRTGASYYPSRFIKEMDLKTATHSTSSPSLGQNSYYASMGTHRPSGNHTLFSASNLQAIKAFVSTAGKARSPEDTYQIGDKVVHTSFGKGTVVELDGADKIIVDFGGDVGKKKLIVGFKMFRKVKEGE